MPQVILVKSVVCAAKLASLLGVVQDALSQKFGLILARCLLLCSTEIATCRPPDLCWLVISMLCWASLVFPDSIPVGGSIPAYTAAACFAQAPVQ